MKIYGVAEEMFMKATVFLFATILITVGLVSCASPEAEWEGTIEVVDGVTIVRNPKVPIYTEDVLELNEELSIGKGADEKDYLFENITDVAVDSNNIYVVDNKASTIRIFSEDGIHLRDIGRKGQGPGEFIYPVSIHITANEHLFVSGFRYGCYFSTDGEFLKQIKTGFNHLRPQLNSIGHIIARTDILMEKKRWELNVYNSEGDKLNTLVGLDFERSVDEYDPYYPIIDYTVLPDDTVVWALNKIYKLMFINKKGDSYLKVEKDYIPVKLRQETIESIKRNQRGDTSRTHIIPENYPPIRGIYSDDAGRIYVQTYELDSNGQFYFDIYSSSGKYLAKVILNGFLSCWHNGKLYSIAQDEDGYQYVKRYKVTWNY